MLRYRNLSGSMRLCDLPQGSTFSMDGGKRVFLLGQLYPGQLQEGECHTYYVTNLDTGDVMKLGTEMVVEPSTHIYCEARLLNTL